MLSVGLEPAIFIFLQTGACHVFMEEKFPILFHCFCLYRTGWDYYGKTYALTFKMGISHENISLWKCFPKYIFFRFSVSFCIHSQPVLWWVCMSITDCDSFLLCFFLSFCILFNSRSYFSGEGNVTWSSKQSPLRLEGVVITENSTVVWIFSDLQGFVAFPKKREWKAWYFSPGDIPLWTCIYLNIDSKAEHEISKPSYSEQQGSCEPLGAKPLVFFSTL